MNFRTFAINYLNPFYLLWRFGWLTYAGASIVIGSAQWAGISPRSSTEVIVVLIAGLSLAILATLSKGKKGLVLGLGGLVASIIGIVLLSNGHPIGIYAVSAGAFSLVINGIRPWGDGVSMDQLSKSMNNFKGESNG